MWSHRPGSEGEDGASAGEDGWAVVGWLPSLLVPALTLPNVISQLPTPPDT